MRVCIVTNYHSTGNYGAVLQAYALNYIINSMGHNCLTLDFSADTRNGSKIERYFSRCKKKEYEQILSDLNRDFGKIIIRSKIQLRKRSIEKFKNCIPHTEYYSGYQLSNIEDEFDCFICGSDQIWRPTFEDNLVDMYWLADISDKVIKASYAASIGISELSERNMRKAKKFLSTFDKISVREEATEEYLKKITGLKEITTVVDPVFLIKRNEWDEITDEIRIEDPFIFVYMIHGSKRMYQSLSEFAKRNKFKIVTFPYMAYYYRSREIGFGDYRIFDATPNQFLEYIRKAQIVFTDSFHATAFSIIFHKNFYVSKANEKAMSRIYNILNICGLENCIIEADGLNASDYSANQGVDWKLVDYRLGEKISFSIEFLESIFDRDK